jgi:glycosyltransferase involved in cell wall biosynthesis
MNNTPTLSIILPARNESAGLRKLLPELRQSYAQAEILVVDDGSTDDTRAVAEAAGAKVISHPYSMGNGAAIKSGARHASGAILVMMDADGQHHPKDISALLESLSRGHAMAVGARSARTHASSGRRLANAIYNRLASYMTGQRIEDLTSGFRAVRAKDFRRFLYLLPNGFSYPTTSTMAFFRSGLPVGYVPIEAARRSGKSHIRLTHDGIRFLMIILKIGTLFSPMRFFLPISSGLFLAASFYYGYTFVTQGRFTNMSALLFTASLLTFLIGILAELVSSLHYREGRLDDSP